MLSKIFKQSPPILKHSPVSNTASIDNEQGLYFTLFEKMADAALLVRAIDDQLINCNEAALKQLAYPNKADLLNQKLSQLSPEYQADGLSSINKVIDMQAIAHHEGFHRFDWQHLGHDDSIISVEVTLTAIKVDEELFFHLAWRDLTEHNQAKLILEQAKQKAELDAKDKTLALNKSTQELALLTQSYQSDFKQAPFGVVNMSLTEKNLETDQNLEPHLLSGINILVVEDDRFNQWIITDILDRFGATHVFANNGAEGLERLEQDHFDAVLMDLHMPLMDGFVATIEIRKLEKFASLPIIALTATVTNEAKQRCENIGMNDFIAKPINVNELITKLTHWTAPSALANNA